MPLKKKLISVALVSALTGALFLSACSKQGEAPKEAPPPDVGVYTVKTQTVTLMTELPGRTSPFMISDVRPQISGIIQQRFFVEGADVKAGATLYQIDPAIYRANYESAKASVAKAEAAVATAQAQAARYTELVKIDAVSRQDNDNAQATLKQTQADVLATKAAAETARINLAYTAIVSPISGRIGKSDYTPGALVTANQPSVLTTVQQLDPIYVDLSQSSNEWLRLKHDMESGRLQSAGENQALVELIFSDGSVYAQKGLLKFSGVTVDQSTGSIGLRAEFKNPKHDLLPGMYVRARLVEGTRSEAILVPQQGITRNTKGEAVALLVADDGTASQRIVKAERAIGSDWLISEGLKPGEKVVVEGVQRVRIIPGAPAPKVKAVEKTEAAATPAVAPKPADAPKPDAEAKPAQTENVSAKS